MNPEQPHDPEGAWPPQDPESTGVPTYDAPALPPSGGSGDTAGPGTTDDRTWAMLAHLSGFLIPILGPLIVLAVRKSESGFVEAHTKEALNMHLTYAIVSVVLGALTMLSLGIGIVCTGPAFMVIGLAYLILMIQATIRANEGQLYRYPYIWRIIT